MEPRLISVEEQRELIPDTDLKATFMSRDDIAGLPLEDREQRWVEHLAKIDAFREWISEIEAYVV